MTERLCIVCPVRDREPEHYDVPHVCPSCRGWLDMLPGDIHRLWARLDEHLTVEADMAWEVQQLRDNRWVTEPGHDPVSSQLPTTASGARVGGDQVSGSRDAPVPINLDIVDLAAPVTGLALTAHGKHWWRDQTGQLSVAMELDLIARGWADHFGHRLPVPTVPALVQWLATRLQDACDRYPGIDANADKLRQLRGVLRSVLGEVDPTPERMGAPCPGCDMLTLIRRPGEDKVECANEDCRRVLTADEYARWSGLVVAAERERMAA